MKYFVRYTNQFKKDLKLAKKQNKELEKMFHVIDLLSKGEVLDIKYKDHPLEGKYSGFRECHIEPDWLLIYEYYDDVLILSLSRLGSHAKLFRK